MAYDLCHDTWCERRVDPTKDCSILSPPSNKSWIDHSWTQIFLRIDRGSINEILKAISKNNIINLRSPQEVIRIIKFHSQSVIKHLIGRNGHHCWALSISNRTRGRRRLCRSRGHVWIERNREKVRKRRKIHTLNVSSDTKIEKMKLKLCSLCFWSRREKLNIYIVQRTLLQ